jgi:hypothetical protein
MKEQEIAVIKGCEHPNVYPYSTPGTFWKCSSCGETFYLHPWDHSKHGILCSPETCGGPPKK